MDRRSLIATWLSNMSVATFIVGGFQEVSTTARIIAALLAVLSLVAAIALVKEGKK